MPERERKQKPAPKERVEETAEVAAPAKQGEELKEELDDLLDEIDSVLEANAEEFVKVLRTKRGRMIRTYKRAIECHTPVVRSSHEALQEVRRAEAAGRVPQAAGMRTVTGPSARRAIASQGRGTTRTAKRDRQGQALAAGEHANACTSTSASTAAP